MSIASPELRIESTTEMDKSSSTDQGNRVDEDETDDIQLRVGRPEKSGSFSDEETEDQEDNPMTDDALEARKYYIIRHSDGLVIAQWKNAHQSLAFPEHRTTKEMLEEVKYGPGYIDLAHHHGQRFTLPWELGRKWIWMKDIIKLTYGSDESAKRSIESGDFELRRENFIILPELWDKLIEKWDMITIKLKPQGSSNPPQSSEQMSGSNAMLKTDSFFEETTSQELKISANDDSKVVKYTVDFLRPGMFGQHPEALSSKTYEHPVVVEKRSSHGKAVPILEEINSIELGSRRNGVPKLSADKNLIIGKDDTVKPKKLCINSPLLLNALRSVVKYSSFISLKEDSDSLMSGQFPFPFHDLYHHRDELFNLRNNTEGSRANHTPEYNEECDQHIDLLVKYLDDEPTVRIISVKRRWAQKVPTTTFSSFWLLMKPGSDVYVQEYGQLNAYVVEKVEGGLTYSGGPISARRYGITVWNLIFNGSVIKRSSKVVDVSEFDGERNIVSLPLFPVSFQDRLDGGALRKHLIERGNKFFRLTQGPSFQEYTGSGLRSERKKYRRARVVVEHQSLPWTRLRKTSLPSPYWYSFDKSTPDTYQDNDNDLSLPRPPRRAYAPSGHGAIGHQARAPRCECSRCREASELNGTYIVPVFSEYDSISPFRANGLSEHQALICMSHMFSFILKDRTYDIINLDHLTEPTFAHSAIDELVLRPPENKDIIKAIARTYTESDSQEDLFGVDFIRGKGEGQIFLLHGPPGTGKTLTAESVAEYTKRPLLSITAADLGHVPEILELNLLRFFEHATSWDAIVLLDEADVYLERRSADNLKRNSIVSVFLRAMDYFEGILFLTTNRIGQFDEAFLSRIHVAIGYDPLDDAAKGQIWETFFGKLDSNHENGGPKMDYAYRAKEYARDSDAVRNLRWNGREIRNAFQTAVALAVADSKAAKAKGRPESECIPRITEAHMRQVVGMSGAFRQYMKTTHGNMEESERAFFLGNRADRTENDKL